MHYELEFDYYKGPLDTLLELIEGKKMEITAVNLAEVTTDFLKYVETLEAQGRRDTIADFLVVASKLILIKSKVLLPALPLSEDEESDIKNLEARLKLYQELKQAQMLIKEQWSVYPQMAEREFLMSMDTFFFPPAALSHDALRQAIGRVSGELEKILRPVAVVKSEIIHLKHKIQEIIDRISDVPFSFKDMHKGRGRGEVVVMFLAILHLIKDQIIDVAQERHFDDMIVAKAAKKQ